MNDDPKADSGKREDIIGEERGGKPRPDTEPPHAVDVTVQEEAARDRAENGGYT